MSTKPPTQVSLIGMTQGVFDDWQEHSIKGFAKDKKRTNGYPAD